MKANGFVKDKGIDEAKRHLECYGWRNTPFIIKLKRLVESHDLVDKVGGMDKAKLLLRMRIAAELYESANEIEKAILDMESCQ